MDELAKTEARNYLSAAGFFLIGASFLLLLLGGFTELSTENLSSLHLALAVGLMVTAILLIILRKRDMIGLLFIMMSFYQFFLAFRTHDGWDIIIEGFLLVVMLVTLTTKDKGKWQIFMIPFLLFLFMVIDYNIQSGGTRLLAYGVLAVLSLYYAFACASERVVLPGRAGLVADQGTDFKAAGSVLGYMLFALTAGIYTVNYLIGDFGLPVETLRVIELLAALLMIVVAILLFTVGKMRFTPTMFLLVGLTDILVVFSSGYMLIGTGCLLIIVGLYALLRKESRILPGIMLIIYGCTDFFSVFSEGALMSLPLVSAILNGIPCIIAIYLAFAVYSQYKLPKF